MVRKLNITDEEWENRINLAACYHLADHFGWSDIIWNHITAKTSTNKNTFLINKFGLRYDEITASNLLEIDLEGNVINGEGDINYTGFVIHGAIHKAKQNIQCVMHTHSRAGLAISCLKTGLEPIIQDAAMFHNRVSYHEWEGMSTNLEECEKLLESLGNNKAEVLKSLKEAKSGIEYCEKYAEMGLRSHVHGSIAEVDTSDIIDRKMLRFMADAAIYNAVALDEAIKHANLSPEIISNNRTGLIMGSGGASNQNIVESADILRSKGIKRVGPYRVPRAMGSTTSACLSTLFKIKGINYSISSACSTSAHCIGNAMEQIQLGKQDVVFAGGGEELDWSLTMLFDAMGALSSKYNDTPEKASRAYDVDRDGFVISGGGGALVLESLEHAEARGAHIIAELVGYGATSDGHDMVAPWGC